jgi:hypothetical protein
MLGGGIRRVDLTLSAIVIMGVTMLAPGEAARGETLTELLGKKGLSPIATALKGAVGRSLPLISASSGIVYTFDFATGTAVRETSILGQLFLERAQPIGKGRFNLNLSYQWVRLDSFDGEDLHALHDTVPIQLHKGEPAFAFPHFSIDLDTQQITASATYGLTEDTEVNLTVPVLISDFTRRFVLYSKQLTPPTSTGESDATKVGVGDIFLRGKYRIVDHDWLQAAMGLVLRLPAGNEENFQGTGDVEMGPRLYVSAKPMPVGRWLQVQPHMNSGVTFDTADVGNSAATYGIGVDCGVPERFTAAVAFLGRSDFQRIAPAGSLSFRRFDGISRPLFGINDERADIFDLSVGGRVNLWRDTIIGFGNVLIALNDSGVRSNVIPTVGIEAAF